MKKWLVGLVCVGMWAGAAWADLSSPATLPVEYAGANGWSNANLDAMTGWDATGLAAPYANSAKFDGAGDKVVIYFDGAPDDIVYSVRRSDNAVLEGPYSATVQESADNSTWSTVRTFDGTELDGTLKTFTNTLATASRYVKFEFVTKPTGQNFGLGYVNVAAGGPAVFGVNLNRQNGFEVEQGASDAITATAASGTEPYSYEWATDMAAGDYNVAGNVFTISATAALGDYSATVTATDSADPQHQAEKAVTFSVVAPAPKYAISIVTNAPENGTVTTTPATEAVAGATVTVNVNPAGGYTVQSIVVNGGSVTGNNFVMPAGPATVTVTFVSFVGSSLFISEVADPSGTGGGDARFVEIYNAGASAVDLAAGQWYLARQANGGSWANIALTGTVNAASTYVISYNLTNYTAAYPAAPLPNQTSGNINGNGDDGYFLYSGGRNTNGVLEDAYGVLDQDGTGMPWEYEDARAMRNAGVTAGNPTWTVAEWTITDPAAYAAMTPGVHPDGAAVFNVNFNKSNGFTVEQGSSDSILATAANGTAPYGYVWTSSLGEDYRMADTNVFTILATAPIGVYTAQVVATDSDTPAKSVTNSLNFSVVAPPPKYAISIVTNNAGEGTVTTTPATEAAAGVTVTVNATPAGGYAVESIVVNGGAVTVTGNTFAMPAGPATVTVTFMEYEAPDVLIDFEDYTTNTYALHVYNTAGVSFNMTNILAGGTAGTDRFNGTKSARFHHNRTAGNAAIMSQTVPFAQPITRMNFWFADYGTDSGGAFKVQVSEDGTAWTDVGEATYDPAGTTLEMAEINVIPANVTFVQFVGVGDSAKRFNVDDVGIFFGAAVPSLSYTGATTIQMGQSFALTFTLNNGTASGWEYLLESASREDLDNGSVNVFNWTPSSAGTYYLTMTALDEASNPIASREVTLTVTPVDPDEPAVIISGSLSGTVGVQMSLAVSITNATAEDWFIDLVDPDALADYTYGFDGSTFTLTPAKAGTYVLTITAVTETGNVSNTVNLVISGGGGEEVWSIGNGSTGGTMFYATSNRNIIIILPTNYTLNAVYGTDSSATGLNNLGQGLGNPLTQDLDYTWTPATRMVSIMSGATNRRVLRIGATPQ